MRRIRLADSGEERFVSEVTEETGERLTFDPAYAVRMVSDIVPNAWIAREIVGGLATGLKDRGFLDEHLAGNPDTEYKQTVLRLMTEWKTRLPKEYLS